MCIPGSVNIAIMRAFVQLREMIASNKGLARRLNELEKKYDGQFRIVFKVIRELMAEPCGSSMWIQTFRSVNKPG